MLPLKVRTISGHLYLHIDVCNCLVAGSVRQLSFLQEIFTLFSCRLLITEYCVI